MKDPILAISIVLAFADVLLYAPNKHDMAIVLHGC